MRHGIAFRKLGRSTEDRLQLLRNLVTSLIKHEAIETTVARGKEVKRIAEKAITLGKKGTIFHRQVAGKYVYDHGVTMPLLFGPLAERYATRPGGYTRLSRIGFSNNLDRADLCRVELVDSSADSKIALEEYARMKSGGKAGIAPTQNDFAIDTTAAAEAAT